MHRAAAPLASMTVSAISLGVAKAPATKTPGRLVSTGSNLSVLQKPYSLSSICMSSARATALGGGSLPTDSTTMSKVLRRSVPCLVLVVQDQVVGVGILFDLGDPAAGVLDAPQVLGLLKVGGVLFAKGPLVHDKDFALDARQPLLGQHRLLGGVHAADGRAVGVLLVARADALQPGDPLRDLAVRWPLDDALGGAGAAGKSLELDAGDDVGIATVAQLLGGRGVVELVAHGQDDGADVDLLEPVFLRPG